MTKKNLKTKDIHIGFAATNEIQKQLQNYTVTIKQVCYLSSYKKFLLLLL